MAIGSGNRASSGYLQIRFRLVVVKTTGHVNEMLCVTKLVDPMLGVDSIRTDAK
jgi:hypothetical protein